MILIFSTCFLREIMGSMIEILCLVCPSLNSQHMIESLAHNRCSSIYWMNERLTEKTRTLKYYPIAFMKGKMVAGLVLICIFDNYKNRHFPYYLIFHYEFLLISWAFIYCGLCNVIMFVNNLRAPFYSWLLITGFQSPHNKPHLYSFFISRNYVNFSSFHLFEIKIRSCIIFSKKWR